MKLGILMSGQGAQTVGMGADLYESLPAYRKVVDQVSDELGYDLMTTVVNDATNITQTRFTQPAIMAMSLGINEALKPVMPQPTASLGLSLGEYSALTAAGVFTLNQATHLIKIRGELMQTVGEQNPGKMVAVMSDDQALIETELRQLQKAGKSVYAANYNTFNQLVIGGVTADVNEAMTTLGEAGISRMVELPVSGAFHTPLLQAAADEFAQVLANEAVVTPSYPVYANTTGRPFEDIQAILPVQMVSPTYFAQALQAMVEAGVDTLIEFGPSDTLIKFAKKVVGKDVKRYCVKDLASFNEVQAMLQAEMEMTQA